MIDLLLAAEVIICASALSSHFSSSTQEGEARMPKHVDLQFHMAK
jgi:hypothetical protein